MRYAYPFMLEPQRDGGFTVTFPDIPEAITEGDTEAKARDMAVDALIAALSFYTDDNRALPKPRQIRGLPVAILPPLIAVKLALHDAVLEAGLSNVELGRRLGIEEKAVRRLRDPLHRSHIDSVQTALLALGKTIEIVVGDAA